MAYTLSTLHLFNPSHDEALAVHSPYYLPPMAARRLAAVLADLPRWWMTEGDDIFSLPPSLQAQELSSINWERFEKIAPWGWNRQIVHFLQKLGAPDRLLPTEEELERWRGLSSRKTNVKVGQWLKALPPIEAVCAPEGRWCEHIDEVEAAIADFRGLAMLKLPWSSSGRGIFSTRLGYDLPCRQRAERGIARYGGIEVQPLFLEAEDGALEWEINEKGEVIFLGCSLFQTTVGGAYLGHRVDRPEALEQAFLHHWQRYTPSSSTNAFSELLSRLSAAIREFIAPHYRGLLGIDVLFTPEGLYPCLEINLRRTMGHVALDIGARLPSEQLPCTFSINAQGLQLQAL